MKTIEITNCEECPYHVDPDPRPSYCAHPTRRQELTGYYMNKGKGTCPLINEHTVLYASCNHRPQVLAPKRKIKLSEADKKIAQLACDIDRPLKPEIRGPSDPNNWNRSSGDCICKVCSKDYYSHPMVNENSWLDWDGHPWLTALCNGSFVKL